MADIGSAGARAAVAAVAGDDDAARARAVLGLDSGFVARRASASRSPSGTCTGPAHSGGAIRALDGRAAANGTLTAPSSSTT